MIYVTAMLVLLALLGLVLRAIRSFVSGRNQPDILPEVSIQEILDMGDMVDEPEETAPGNVGNVIHLPIEPSNGVNLTVCASDPDNLVITCSFGTFEISMKDISVCNPYPGIYPWNYYGVHVRIQSDVFVQFYWTEEMMRQVTGDTTYRSRPRFEQSAST